LTPLRDGIKIRGHVINSGAGAVLSLRGLIRLLIEDKADQMSGPIVRTGTTPAFWKNWEQAFGGKKTEGSAKKKASGGEKKPVVAAKKAAKKAGKKAAAKKKK
jgi:hypothetical protein